MGHTKAEPIKTQSHQQIPKHGAEACLTQRISEGGKNLAYVGTGTLASKQRFMEKTPTAIVS